MSRKICETKGKFPLEIASVFKPKSMTCVRNVVCRRKTPKTPFQEELLVFVGSFHPSPKFISSTY